MGAATQLRGKARHGSGRHSIAALLVAMAGLAASGCQPAAAPAEATSQPRPALTNEAPDSPAAEPGGEQSTIGDSLPATAMSGPEPGPGRTRAQSTRSDAETALLRAVRAGRQSGADRLVFEFEGSGLPEWSVEYVDRPLRDCGSGDAVPVAGDAWLQVGFIGAQAHTEAGEPTSGPRRRAIDQDVVLELLRTCDFEGHVSWVAGVASPNRFTVTALTNPSRLVIDVDH